MLDEAAAGGERARALGLWLLTTPPAAADTDRGGLRALRTSLLGTKEKKASALCFCKAPTTPKLKRLFFCFLTHSKLSKADAHTRSLRDDASPAPNLRERKKETQKNSS